MLIAGLGVVAALAFVLGLGALCLWALKRWGTGALGPRTRIPVEVVQRVALGPKTGLAVVRVGDKVMAVSVGDGEIRPLFEVSEADRQRVIATSTIPTPMVSSPEAAAAFRSLQSLPGAFGSMLGKAMGGARGGEIAAPIEGTDSAAADRPMHAPVAVVPLAQAMIPAMPFSMTEPAEVPRFLMAPPTTSRGDAATYGRSSSMRVAPWATRLAVFAGAMMLVQANALQAQAAGAPPVTPPIPMPIATPVAPSTGAVTAPSAPGVNAATTRAATTAPVVIPQTIDAPPVARATNLPGARLSTPPSMNRPAAQSATAQPPRTGNGATVTNRGTAAPRPVSAMAADTAAGAGDRARAATPAPIAADEAIMRMMPQMDMKLGGDGETGGLRLNGTVGIVVMMGLLTLLPTLLLMMTGFTRILIVLHFLKQAMGTQSAPPGQLIAGLALLLTGFVMGPTLSEVNRTAITPWMDGNMTQVEMMKTGVQPMREFMLRQTRESDLKTFVEMSRMPKPATVNNVPLHVLMSAFVASELRTAFQIGFAIYLPFIIIDTVVASVLMSMGMFMLPPAMISLPFKLLLFVLVDGWSLMITSLVQSFK